MREFRPLRCFARVPNQTARSPDVVATHGGSGRRAVRCRQLRQRIVCAVSAHQTPLCHDRFDVHTNAKRLREISACSTTLSDSARARIAHNSQTLESDTSSDVESTSVKCRQCFQRSSHLLCRDHMKCHRHISLSAETGFTPQMLP